MAIRFFRDGASGTVESEAGDGSIGVSEFGRLDRVFFVLSWIIVGGFLVLVVLQNTGIFAVTDYVYTCAFLSITGFYCPGCGGTHAVAALAGGHVIDSFLMHPFVPYVIGCALIFAIWNTVAGIRRRGYLHFHPLAVYIGLGILGLQWIIKNILLLANK